MLGVMIVMASICNATIMITIMAAIRRDDGQGDISIAAPIV